MTNNQNKTIEIPIRFPFPDTVNLQSFKNRFFNLFDEMTSNKKELYAVSDQPHNTMIPLETIAGIFRSFRVDDTGNILGVVEMLQTRTGSLISQLLPIPLVGKVCCIGNQDGEISEIVAIQLINMQIARESYE